MHHLLVVHRVTLLHLFIYWDGEMFVLIMDGSICIMEQQQQLLEQDLIWKMEKVFIA